MLDGMKVQQAIGVSKHRWMLEGVEHTIKQMRGLFKAQHIRGGRVIGEYRGENGITIVGKNHLLDVVFGAATPLSQVDPWYIGLINQTPTPSLAEADTLASHSGWAETATYTGNRKEWDDADAASKIKGTTSVSQFDMSGTVTVHGILICSAATGTSGTLWSTGAFSNSIDCVNGDTLKVTYGLRT